MEKTIKNKNTKMDEIKKLDLEIINETNENKLLRKISDRFDGMIISRCYYMANTFKAYMIEPQELINTVRYEVMKSIKNYDVNKSPSLISYVQSVIKYKTINETKKLSTNKSKIITNTSMPGNDEIFEAEHIEFWGDLDEIKTILNNHKREFNENEYSTIELTLQDKNITEISVLINRSPRMVRRYLQSAINKLKVHYN